ncbi:thioredoxin-like protein [Xylogone sp. PMI_703]|nr:thioredoxin-like protein [Xylogone sp. PMI_703]
MPSMRRMKVFALLVLVFVVTTLFYTASLRQQRTLTSQSGGDFYGKTRDALDRIHEQDASGGGGGGGGKSSGGTAGSNRDDDDEELAKAMKQRLDEAAQLAKDKANVKSPKPDPPSKVVGVGNAADAAWGEEKGIAGRKKYSTGEEAQKPVKEETAEEHEVEVELNSILKKSPIIIFSKSYCPHSKRAKHILLDKYDINPAPYVVELDLHEIGTRLQARLAEITGRRTVPNVLVNGKSIGGGDEVAALDESQTLIGTIKDMVGKRVEISLKPAEEAPEKAEAAPEKNEIPEKGL